MPPDAPSRTQRRRTAADRARFRRRRILVGLVALTFVLVCGGVARAVFTGSAPDATPAPSSSPAVSAAASPSPSLSPSPSPSPAPRPITYPERGTGRWNVAPGPSPVIGRAGRLLRFRVSVEGGIQGVAPGEFAAATLTALGDPRSWTAGGQWRFQQVPAGSAYDFTIYLATPLTRDVLCANGRDLYTSCRNGNSVVVNVARWAHGVPNYGAGLDLYRMYVINHEVGHRLGHGHEKCPGAGKLAPLMEQQTLGLHGCTANAWPYVNGKRYTGPSGAYNDPLPVDP
ncbi:hypothetical protein Cs7R123_07840 [Catellatospora sp. TT07R-123]|uniref:DUF3152 domain-containing protein n=1 Tax=Catellatospora sp. TT07R-123 TaxID=2733863 RepID=UPI001B118AA6|nr:DUF3152 domain-containing protein [Catellatospora sp. TT07R-123]GHJ43442.1 hypothetical protein Cs7R123_07840 [Catellatospora sp. TT07R-123]